MSITSRTLLLLIACALLAIGIFAGYTALSNATFDDSFLLMVSAFMGLSGSALLFSHLLTVTFVAPKGLEVPFNSRGEKFETLKADIGEAETKRIYRNKTILFFALTVLILVGFVKGFNAYEHKVLAASGVAQKVVIAGTKQGDKNIMIAVVHYTVDTQIYTKELRLNDKKQGDTGTIVYAAANPKIAVWQEDLKQ